MGRFLVNSLGTAITLLLLQVLGKLLSAIFKAVFTVEIEEFWNGSAQPFLRVHLGEWTAVMSEYTLSFWGGAIAALTLFFVVDRIRLWVRRKASQDLEAISEVKATAKVKISNSERPAKIAAIDKALDLLSNSGELSEARNDIQAAQAIWRQAAQEDRINPYLREYSALLDRFEKALRAVRKNAEEFKRYTDVYAVLATISDDHTTYPIHEFKDMMKRLGPKPSDNHCQLFEHYAKKCREALVGIEERRSQATDGLLELRREISS